MLADTIAPASRTVTTRYGKTIAFRPSEAADEAALAEFFDRVSDEDRRFRFFTPRKHLTHEQLVPLIEVDHVRTESFLAFDADSGAVVAHAMLACDDQLDTGEIAVSVCSTWRRQGLGWAMLDVLAEAAKARGLRRVIAIEDRENHAAIELEREKGFTPHGVDGDPHLVMLEKVLR
ncbi:MAG: GNAT family N-acetyltransferase [Sphingomonadaceae bacterium]